MPHVPCVRGVRSLGVSLFALGLLALAAGLTAAAPPVSPAVQTLTEKGLVKKGSFWITADEAKILEYDRNLKELERKTIQSQAQFEELVKQGKAAKEAYTQTRKEYDKIQELIKAGGLTPQQTAQLNQESNKRVPILQKAQPLIVDLQGQMDNAAFNAASAEFRKDREDLTLALIYLEKNAVSLDEKYAELKEDPEVKAALLKLPGARLGPSRDFKKEPIKTAPAEKLVYSNTLPLYRSKGVIVFDVLLNGTTFLPIGDGRVNDYTMIPQKVIEASGQKIPPDAQVLTLNANGKQYKTRLVKLGSLRIGKYVLTDTDVLAMPDDAQGLPTTLGRKTLNDFELTSDLPTCRITIKSTAEADKERAGEKKTPGKLVVPILPNG
ncbi:MAG TPA: hypothetical protein VFE24_17575 [Pirellulales bacterium]|nr:hypothetical protein [Pirellulales bacterium]